jgi:hypothetical protein
MVKYASTCYFSLKQMLGNDWTFYSPSNDIGQMNILSSPVKVVASRILHLLLTQAGEDPIHPTLGIAPRLFEPLSSPSSQFFVYNAREEILKWNEAAKIGITGLSVEMESQQEYRNDITIRISFTTLGDRTTNTLAFNYFAYTGARYENTVVEFIDGVILNGQPFPRFGR